MAFSLTDGDSANNLPPSLNIRISLDILCGKSDFFQKCVFWHWLGCHAGC